MRKHKKWAETFSSNYHKPAGKTYCIAFTPRSGSTWLGDILTKSGKLGEPKEYFNQDAAHHIISQSACTSVEEYFRYIKTVRQSTGVFGFEAAYKHISNLIDEGYQELLDDIDHWFLLLRKDYVAQAVSLYRASHSGIFHSYQKNEPLPATPYDKNKIARFALSTMNSEYRLSQYFQRQECTPRTLWYEDLVNMEYVDVIQLFASELNVPLSQNYLSGAATIATSFRKVSDQNSQNLIDRFATENPGFISYWDANRGQKTVRQFLLKNLSYATLSRDLLS